MRRQQAQQIKSALELIGPMGEMIEACHQVILAHHPLGVTPDDCPVCLSYEDQMRPIVQRWADVRAKIEEHWDG